VGIVTCYAEFIESGILAACRKALPFPLAGITTLASAGEGALGAMLFTLTVLTSDDVEFEVGVSGPVSSSAEAPLREAYESSAAKRPEKPVFMVSFAPLLMNLSGDFFVKAFDDITGGVPNFGTLAVDHTNDYHLARTLKDGEAFADRYVFVLVYGNAAPSFFVASISEERAFSEKGVVTASEGNLLKSVNNIPVSDYLVNLGLPKDEKGSIIGVNSFPFILDFNDGTPPIVRAIFAMTPDGSAVCGGEVPVGSTLTVGRIDAAEVLATAEKVLRETAGKNGGGKEARTQLVFSCVGRYFAQGYDPEKEMETARDVLKGQTWNFAYSGGEICPVRGKDGKLVNRSHNDSLVVCVI
jgi:hypothetical protein